MATELLTFLDRLKEKIAVLDMKLEPVERELVIAGGNGGNGGLRCIAAAQA